MKKASSCGNDWMNLMMACMKIWLYSIGVKTWMRRSAFDDVAAAILVAGTSNLSRLWWRWWWLSWKMTGERRPSWRTSFWRRVKSADRGLKFIMLVEWCFHGWFSDTVTVCDFLTMMEEVFWHVWNSVMIRLYSSLVEYNLIVFDCV